MELIPPRVPILCSTIFRFVFQLRRVSGWLGDATGGRGWGAEHGSFQLRRSFEKSTTDKRRLLPPTVRGKGERELMRSKRPAGSSNRIERGC